MKSIHAVKEELKGLVNSVVADRVDPLCGCTDIDRCTTCVLCHENKRRIKDKALSILVAVEDGGYLEAYGLALDCFEEDAETYRTISLMVNDLVKTAIFSVRMNRHDWVTPPECNRSYSETSYAFVNGAIWKRRCDKIPDILPSEAYEYTEVKCMNNDVCKHLFEPSERIPECDIVTSFEYGSDGVLTFYRLAKDANENAIAKGFHSNRDGSPKERNVGEALALIHSEVSEALEESRKNSDLSHTYYREDGKPEGFIFEIADIFIRCGDLLGQTGLDFIFEKAVREKMKFNATRPHMHGKEF